MKKLTKAETDSLKRAFAEILAEIALAEPGMHTDSVIANRGTHVSVLIMVGETAYEAAHALRYLYVPVIDGEQVQTGPPVGLGHTPFAEDHPDISPN